MAAAEQAAAEEDPRAAPGSQLYRRSLLALFCAGLATFAQMYSPQGVLPELAADFGIAASTSSWAIGATTIGIALGVLPWARVSDHVGRVAAMRSALGAALVVGLLAPFAPNFELLIAARFAEGIALAGLPAIAVTAIAETVQPRALGAAVGTYVAGTTLGGLVGRIVAAGLGEPFGWRWGMAAVAVLAGIAMMIFMVRIPRTVVPAGSGLPILRATLANLRRPGVIVLVVQAFLLMGGFVAVYNYLAFRLQDAPFDLSLAQVSWIFLAYLAGAVTSRTVWRVTRVVPPTAVLLGCIALMLGGLGLTLVPQLLAVIVGLVVFTGCFFAAHTVASGLIAGRAGEGRSLAPPLYNLGYYAGSSVLGWVGGVAYGAGGWAGTVAVVAAAAFLAAIVAFGYAKTQGGISATDRS
ncbi:MFS transporter [Leucobacter luti]|uniref:MFS transporter n=1 Tax=Leucobacter luti TaxID=340320 RepID=UPI001C691270|nr:MFS transporter [Leucobacter luti]QYM77014.1 MFS transporter [Leucobacter luti]